MIYVSSWEVGRMDEIYLRPIPPFLIIVIDDRHLRWDNYWQVEELEWSLLEMIVHPTLVLTSVLKIISFNIQFLNHFLNHEEPQKWSPGRYGCEKWRNEEDKTGIFQYCWERGENSPTHSNPPEVRCLQWTGRILEDLLSIESETPGRTGGLASEREGDWSPYCCTCTRVRVSQAIQREGDMGEVCFLRISVDLNRF